MLVDRVVYDWHYDRHWCFRSPRWCVGIWPPIFNFWLRCSHRIWAQINLTTVTTHFVSHFKINVVSALPCDFSSEILPLGSSLGLHIGCVAVENRNLFLFIHHPMVVVYLYLRCHKEEGVGRRGVHFFGAQGRGTKHLMCIFHCPHPKEISSFLFVVFPPGLFSEQGISMIFFICNYIAGVWNNLVCSSVCWWYFLPFKNFEFVGEAITHRNKKRWNIPPIKRANNLIFFELNPI